MGAFSHGPCHCSVTGKYLLVFLLLSVASELDCFRKIWPEVIQGGVLKASAQDLPVASSAERPASHGAGSLSLSAGQTGRALAETSFNAGSKIVLAAIVEDNALEPFDAVIQMAVDNLNQNSSDLFGGAELELRVVRPTRDQYEVAVVMLDVLQSATVAVLGPVYSFSARIASPLATAGALPLLSFAATDIGLSDKSVHPYFLRTVHSDELQMEALANLVTFFNWTEVVAFHVNDDFGFGGVQALESMLSDTKARVTERVSIPYAATQEDIFQVLQRMRNVTETTVYVVHILPTMVQAFFKAADDAAMMKSGFTWLLSDSTLGALSFMSQRDADLLSLTTEGVVGMQLSVPQSPERDLFERQLADLNISANTAPDSYVFHAYDAVQLIGHAIAQGIRDGQLSASELTGQGDVSAFGRPWHEVHGNGSLGVGGVPNNALSNCIVRSAGAKLLNLTLALGMSGSFRGVAGAIKLDENGDNVNVRYSFINMVGGKRVVVGSWTQQEGLKLSPAYLNLAANMTSDDFPLISWPGRGTAVPIGWLPNSGRALRVAVPINAFQPFVVYNPAFEGNAAFTGQVVEIFESAIKLLPFPISFDYFPVNFSTYNAMCQSVADGTFDVAVGDISITDSRSKFVDFTQQFQSAGLVVIAPLLSSNSNLAWAFLQPYTWDMWLAMMGLFLFMALVIWWLERGKTGALSTSTPPRKAFGRALWWSYTTLFFSHAPIVRTPLGRIVTGLWLFVVLIVVSSYQANLTSTLTVKQLQPTVTGILTLIQSKLVIGVLKTAWYSEALVTLGVPGSRILGLAQNFADHAAKLKLRGRRGGVDAIVDELPYAMLFTQENCEYSIVGQEFYKGGWGWPFPKGSRLQPALSTAILQLSKDSTLYRIQQKWLTTSSQCARTGMTMEVNRLGLQALGPLFLILVSAASVACLIVLVLRAVDHWLLHRRAPHHNDGGSSPESMEPAGNKSKGQCHGEGEEEEGGGGCEGDSEEGKDLAGAPPRTRPKPVKSPTGARGQHTRTARGSWLRATIRLDHQDSMGI